MAIFGGYVKDFTLAAKDTSIQIMAPRYNCSQ